MNKKIIITILLVLVTMAGQAQSPIPESIVDTYWRNEVTGDWEIGFTESCAIYDCKIWQYGNINEKNGKVVLALNNGNKTLGVTIGKQEGGKCKMSIGKQKKQTYSLITTRTLSYYPQPDQTPFIDNSFQEGDSATITGWIKDYPESKGKSLAFEARFGGFVPGRSSTIKGQTDRDGNYAISYPITEVYPQVFSWLELLDINVWIILALMVCVAGFTMISGLLIIILERTQMIGTLKALGARNKAIRKTFLWFAVFIISQGLFWGNIVGIGIVLVQQHTGLITLDPRTYYVSEAPMELNLPLVVLINLATLFICVFVLIAPSFLISHIHPAKSMRYE